MECKAIFTIEEHHEAFLVWHYALRNKLLQVGQRTTLLHVDHHADMKTFPLRQPIPELSASWQALQQFTYNELTISSFIIPAIYQKLFYDICWLLPKGIDLSKSGIALNEKKYLYVRSYKERQKTLLLHDDPFMGFSEKPWQDRRSFCFYCQTVEQPFTSDSPVVLDIDLDYFACAKLIDRFQRLEITPAEFQRCQTEKYRKLNLHFKYYLEQEDGHFYICFNPPAEVFENHQQSLPEGDILAKITQFISYLREQQISPALINICRSRHSGYTPQDRCEFIEHHLLTQLRQLYDLNPISIET